jgi:aminopeptidase-like protein
LASFENWAGVMGGILKAAGVPGFMGNQDDLTGLSDGRDDELASVVQAIAEAMHGMDDARLYVGSKSDKETAHGKFGLFDILHAMDDTPRLDQWGYVVDRVSGEVRYENTRKAGLRFKAAAKRTYRVELEGAAYKARFEAEHDSRTNGKCYRLDLEAA